MKGGLRSEASSEGLRNEMTSVSIITREKTTGIVEVWNSVLINSKEVEVMNLPKNGVTTMRGISITTRRETIREGTMGEKRSM